MDFFIRDCLRWIKEPVDIMDLAYHTADRSCKAWKARWHSEHSIV